MFSVTAETTRSRRLPPEMEAAGQLVETASDDSSASSVEILDGMPEEDASSVEILDGR